MQGQWEKKELTPFQKLKMCQELTIRGVSNMEPTYAMFIHFIDANKMNKINIETKSAKNTIKN